MEASTPLDKDFCFKPENVAKMKSIGRFIYDTFSKGKESKDGMSMVEVLAEVFNHFQPTTPEDAYFLGVFADFSTKAFMNMTSVERPSTEELVSKLSPELLAVLKRIEESDG